jgi:hypothetical protein
MLLDESKLLLCFHSGEYDQLRVALQYWSISADGKSWLNATQPLADELGVRVDQLAGVLAGIAQGYDLRTRCDDCGMPRVLTSRTSFQQSWEATFICSECTSTRTREQRLQLQAKMEEQNAWATGSIQNECASNRPFNYSTIDYFDAVLVYAIMLSSDSACSNGQIGSMSELRLCPTDEPLLDITRRLFRRRIIQFSPSTPLEAIAPRQDEHRNGLFSYYPMRVNWRLADDLDGRSFPTVFGDLGEIIDTQDLNTDYEEAISDLWWMLAVDESIRYLNEQVDSYRLPSYVSGDKSLQSLQYVLDKFSIPQVRNLIWTVVKNAAALSTKREYTSRHALNTIPGNLIRYCDRAIAEKWEVKPYLRNWSEDEPMLTTLLFDRVLRTGVTGFSRCNGTRFMQQTQWK